MGMLGLSQGPFRPTLLPPGLVELTKISDDLILSESDFQLNWAHVTENIRIRFLKKCPKSYRSKA